MEMFSIHLISAKSNDITQIFLKSILYINLCRAPLYEDFMSAEHFEIKNEDLRPF